MVSFAPARGDGYAESLVARKFVLFVIGYLLYSPAVFGVFVLGIFIADRMSTPGKFPSQFGSGSSSL